MKAVLVILLAGALLFLAGWFFLIKPEESLIQVETPAESVQPADANSRNTSLTSTERAELERLAPNQADESETPSDEPKMAREFNLETRVRSGEKVVVDVYEGELGEYIFTTLTPTFNPPDGLNPTLIDLKVDSYRFFTDGEMNDISDATLRFLPGQRGELVAPVYTGSVTPGQTTAQGEEYIFDLSVSDPEGDSIILKARGSSRSAEVKVNSANTQDISTP